MKRTTLTVAALFAVAIGLVGAAVPAGGPHRQRGNVVYRRLWRAELHGRTVGIHHRPASDPHRPDQGRDPGRGSLACRRKTPPLRVLLKNHGIRDGPVRQEPSRRPRRAPADEPWLRRVLRQSVPSQCRRGAGESSDYPEGRRTFARRFGPRGRDQVLRRTVESKIPDR